MTANVRLMFVGVLLLCLVVVVWDWTSREWRHPRLAAGLALAAGLMIGYALGSGPDQAENQAGAIPAATAQGD